jgi:hypothetical protein
MLAKLQILVLQFGVFHRVFCRANNVARLEHKRHRAGKFDGFEFGVRGFFKRFGVGSVRRSFDCEGSRRPPQILLLCVVLPETQAHKFRHIIAVKPRRAKRIFLHEPSVWKITKSQFATPISGLGAVKTVKILGSGWSKEIEPIVLNRRKSYL